MLWIRSVATVSITLALFLISSVLSSTSNTSIGNNHNTNIDNQNPIHPLQQKGRSCSSHPDCSTCILSLTCGWCSLSNTCLQSSQSSSCLSNFHFSTCPTGSFSTCPWYTNCLACLHSQPDNCNWCTSTATCGGSLLTSECSAAGVIASADSCPDCTKLADCNDCTTSSTCGWCMESGTCTEGTSTGPIGLASCSGRDNWRWLPSFCSSSDHGSSKSQSASLGMGAILLIIVAPIMLCMGVAVCLSCACVTRTREQVHQQQLAAHQLTQWGVEMHIGTTHGMFTIASRATAYAQPNSPHTAIAQPVSVPSHSVPTAAVLARASLVPD